LREGEQPIETLHLEHFHPENAQATARAAVAVGRLCGHTDSAGNDEEDGCIIPFRDKNCRNFYPESE
jgi:hypothetical protein